MFTKRHEKELAEIKALTYELGERFEQVLAELERIKAAQDQLAANDQPAEPSGGDTVQPIESAAAGAKRARRAQSAAPVPVEASARGGKRLGKGGSRSASDAPKQSTKRAKPAAAEGVAAEDSGGKKRGGGRKRRQAAKPAVSGGSEE